MLRSIFGRQLRNIYLKDCVVIGGMSTTFEISGCAIDLVISALKNVNINVDLSFTLSCEISMRLAILGFPVNLSGD